MPSSAALRSQIESTLAHRIPSALTPAARAEGVVAATGLPALDKLLSGGLPVGAISELVGPISSGRTSTALAFIAQRASEGQVCAWVDVQDALDPESAAANGVLLPQLLWVRCGRPHIGSSVASAANVVSQKTTPASREVSPVQHGCCGSLHPRTEARGMDRAVAELMQRRSAHIRDKTIGTPGVGNRPLGHVPRDEQVSSDRAPKRRGQATGHQQDLCPRCAEAAHKPRPEKPCVPLTPHHPVKPRTIYSPSPAWTLMDQALRATDLLLQAGGFCAIVLDMGDTAAEYSSRIPLATWFRYRQAAEQSRCSLIVLSQRPCAGSSAGVVVRFAPLAMQDAGGRVMQSAQFQASVTKQRYVPAIEISSPRKPVASASVWSSAMRDAV